MAKLKLFTWTCLLIALIAVVYQVIAPSTQHQEPRSLFVTSMIVMAVGFNLVHRELTKVRDE